VKLVYHGVNVEAAVPRVPAASEPRVLSVGRLVEKKGYDNLIRAAERLRGRGVAFTLRIAGDGDQWPKLQRLVHELDLGRHVTFLGPLTPGELRSEWARASVFALACRRLPNGDRDGLPNVLLEAMVNGLPIVSTTQPGIVDAIQDGQNGLLVYPDNPDALADALERVLTQPRLAVELGEGAAASVRTRFDRRQLLPLVSDALAEAQLIPRRVSPRSEIEARVLEPAGA
jgi:glycosyltransferase involved in cell wall biosynthesis